VTEYNLHSLFTNRRKFIKT